MKTQINLNPIQLTPINSIHLFKNTTMKTPQTPASGNFRNAIRKAALGFATVAVLATAQPSLAGNEPLPGSGTLQTAVFQLPNTVKFKAIAKSSQAGNMTVRIRNAKNEVVFTDFMRNASGYYRTFDLSDLADGTYTFEISNGSETRRQAVSIETTLARTVSVQ